jgi:hypothetical protein
VLTGSTVEGILLSRTKFVPLFSPDFIFIYITAEKVIVYYYISIFVIIYILNFTLS